MWAMRSTYPPSSVGGGGTGEGQIQEAKHAVSWPNTTSAWAGWSRFDMPVDKYGGVHSLLICTSSTLGTGVSYLPPG